MLAIVGFLVILSVSYLVVRVAGVALSLTGMSRDSAMFQARSAWTGTGFTTGESEGIVNHPVRRKIVSVLMVVRGGGFVTMIATLVVGLTGADGDGFTFGKIALLIGGVGLLFVVATNDRFDRWMQKVIGRALKRYTTIDVRDYVSLFHLAEEYEMAELEVERGGWMAYKSLVDLKLPEEGVLVLGIERPRRIVDGEVEEAVFIGAPRGRTVIRPGDRVVLYGREDELAKLRERRAGWAGEQDRAAAVAEQKAKEELDERRAAGPAEEVTSEEAETETETETKTEPETKINPA